MFGLQMPELMLLLGLFCFVVPIALVILLVARLRKR